MIAAGLTLTILAGALFIPSLVQRIRHRRTRRLDAVRRHEWADARREAELVRIVGQRDRYYVLYHEAVKVNAVLLQRVGGDNPLALGAEATVTARALNADELAWDDEVWS